MLRAIKIRLYPNSTQATQINKLLGCYRVVYNQCLARKIKSYEENKVIENITTLGHFVHNELLKDENFIWLNEQNTKVLKQAVIDMLTAYKNFFERHTGYPKFICLKVKQDSFSHDWYGRYGYLDLSVDDEEPQFIWMSKNV